MNKTVALFLEHESNPYVQYIRAQAEREAKQHDLEVETFYCDNRFVQIQQLYSAIHSQRRRPIAVAVMPAREGSLARVARAALGSGMDWICLHRRTGELETLRRAFPRNVATLVAPNQHEIGRQQARLVRALGADGPVLYVQGNAANASTQERLAGFRQVATFTDEAGIIDGNWTTEDARLATERWLHIMLPSLGTLGAAVCQSDAMAIGVKGALAEAAARTGRSDLQHVPVIGCDGIPDVGRRLVDEKQLAGTVVIQDVGAFAVRLVAKRLRGQVPSQNVVLSPSCYSAIGFHAEPLPLPEAVPVVAAASAVAAPEPVAAYA